MLQLVTLSTAYYFSFTYADWERNLYLPSPWTCMCGNKMSGVRNVVCASCSYIQELMEDTQGNTIPAGAS